MACEALSPAAEAPRAPEATHLQRALSFYPDVMLSVLDFTPDGACTLLFVSPGVQPLLGYTPEEYLKLGRVVAAHAHARRAAGGGGDLTNDSATARAVCVRSPAPQADPDGGGGAPGGPERGGGERRGCAQRPGARLAARALPRGAQGGRHVGGAGVAVHGARRQPVVRHHARRERGARGGARPRALKELLLSTSFDLRCSAQSVSAASALLRGRAAVAADAEAAFLADAVRTSCNQLNGLASNVLELRKLERGELTPTRAPFDVRATVRGVLQMCRMARCAGADIAWANEAQEAAALPTELEGDETMVSLVLQNLATNSLKFAHDGTQVRVHVALEPPAGGSGSPPAGGAHTLVVSVSDRSAGIAAGDLERIFQKYARAAPERGGGTGLGLHISRGFARAMGGDISVCSTQGEGSTFTLRVPVQLLAPGEAAAKRRRLADDSRQSEHEATAAAAAEAAGPPMPAPDLSARVTPEQLALRPPPAKDPFSELSLEDMLKELLEDAREVFTYMRCGADGAARFVYVSPSARAVLGWEPAALVGRVCSALLHPDDVDKHSHAAASLEDVGTMFGMRRMQRADGSYAWMHLEVVRDGDACFGLWRDAARFKDTHAALREYLLATSHDMRTPVTSLLTAAQLLEQRGCVRGDAEASFLVQTIRSCGQLMLSVIANVLDMQALCCSDYAAVGPPSSARLVLAPRPFCPRALLEEVLAACCAAMGHGAAALALRVEDAALPPVAVADADRLQRILQNSCISLLRHAAHDSQLEVRAACTAPPTGADAAELEVTMEDPRRDVHDNIDFERIFRPSFSSSTPTHGGLHSGLGLCVARAFARAMGGSLTASRKVGEGAPGPSGFVMRLRVPVRLPAPDEALPTPAADAGRVQRQMECHAAGAAGTQAQLPPTPEEPLPSAAATPPPPASPESPRTPRPLRMLLVDDHELNLRLVSTLLRSRGFSVTTAAHGAHALAALQAAAAPGGPGLPDAVLCDIQMPIMDGHAFARAFRQWEAATQPPGARLRIVALSANVLDEHVAQSLAAGMDAHLAKPLRPEAVNNLRRLLSRGS